MFIRKVHLFFLNVLLFVFLTSSMFAVDVKNTDNFALSYLGVEDGLSQNEVTSIVRDKYGFMWFGTRGGLNRYDGYTFEHFKPSADKGLLQLNPSIERLFTDSGGDIFIGTKSGGFGVYSLTNETYKRIDSLNVPIPNRIISFYEDFSGDMWFGSWENGIFKYHSDGDSIDRYLQSSRINTITQSPDSTIWCGTQQGLFYKRPGESWFRQFRFKSSYSEITKIELDPNGTCLWMVGWGNNLICLDYRDFSFKEFRNNQVGDMATYSLMIGKNGGIWVGTWGNGLFLFDKEEEVFKRIQLKKDELDVFMYDFEVILDIFEDHKGDIWLGTDGYGVIRLSYSSRFSTLSDAYEYSDDINHINAVFLDDDNRLWLGTKGSGLFVSDKNNSLNKVGFYNEPAGSLYETNIVKFIYADASGLKWVGVRDRLFIVEESEDKSPRLILAADYLDNPELSGLRKVLNVLIRDKEMWVGTQQDGLFLYHFKDGAFRLTKRFRSGNSPGMLGDNRISSVIEDGNGKIWVGTYKGLFVFEETDTTFTLITSLLKDPKDILCDIILCTYLDSRSNIWFGTPCSLNRIDTEDDGKFTIKEFPKSSGLADDYVNSILEDDMGNIWISTNAGISRIDSQNDAVLNYDVSDGVGGYNFSETSCFKSKNGTLYFGGHLGLTFFNPSDIAEEKYLPPIAITSFKILNQPITVGKNSILPVSVNELNELIVTHKEKEFSIEFAALSFNSPLRNQYAYKMTGSGFNNEWVNLGSRRHISFRNLKQGNYTLQMIGSNSNGVWNNEGKILRIKVLPPPWKTWYAITGYIFVTILIVYTISWIGIRQERLANRAKLEELKRLEDHEKNEFKLRFFTNISHEIRTPLTLIQSPLSEIQSKNFSEITQTFLQDKLRLITKNTNQLIDLVNQLIEFRKVEAGKTRLKAAELDISEFVSSSLANFLDYGKLKGVSHEFLCDPELSGVYLDKPKFEIVLNNLLSNAFKFAGENGKVSVSLKETDTEVVLKIENSGEGIPAPELEHIFERFYQVPGRNYYGSSGIGLALVKNYIDLHKGTIFAESTPGQFTRFVISLKKGRDHLTDEEIRDEQNPQLFVKQSDSEVIVRSNSDGFNEKQTHKEQSVLIIEDNSELRQYLHTLLSEYYHVYEAEDGDKGHEKAMELLPDVIISDVMMPGIDGFELCKRLKENNKTAFIPLILLTAKDTAPDNLLGIKMGADAYITKPFEPVILFEKVKQLIESRKVMALKYTQKVYLDPLNKEISSEDGILLKKAVAIVEKYMQIEEFDSEYLAKELGMSASTLYRKFKKLLNQAPGDFIKSIRLKKAAALLTETNETVSEIVTKVGYSDVKNFRKSFEDFFGKLPDKYRHKNG